MVFKLYSWHICGFEKARKYAASGGFHSLYLHLFSAIFSFIFCDCPFGGFEGHGITCVADLLDNEKVWKVMLELSQDIGHRLRLHKLKATGVQISIRSNDLGYRQFQAPLSLSTQSPMMIAKKAHAVFQTNYRWSTPVRAVTVRAINLVPQGVPEQIDLFTDMRRVEKAEKLDDCIEEIRRRFGKRAVFQACLLGDLKMPIDNRHLVQMPGVVGR